MQISANFTQRVSVSISSEGLDLWCKVLCGLTNSGIASYALRVWIDGVRFCVD